MEQPPISLLWASCSPLCRDPHSCPLLEKGGDKDTPQDGVCRDTQTISCFCPQAPEMGVPRATGPGPNHALHSRFLVLVALQTSHLTHVHLGHVYVCVNHKLILANAEKGRPSVRLGAGGR